MYEQRVGEATTELYASLQENSGGCYGNPTTKQSSLSSSSAASFGHHPAAPPSNVDRTLYNDLVDLVPLVETLIDRKASSSFTRRGSVIYTKTPSSLTKKNNDLKGKTKYGPGKKLGDDAEKNRSKNSDNDADGADGFSISTSVNMVTERDFEELFLLKQQVEDMQRKLMEKDELLNAAENSKNQMKLVQAKYDDLKQQMMEKDSLIKSTQQQLSDAKINLADKQAALEKLQWEAMVSKQKVEIVQGEINSMQTQMSSFMMVFEGLMKDDDSVVRIEDYDVVPYQFKHVPELDDMDSNDMLEMEEARKAYLDAVASAKEKQDEESMKAARNARVYLQSFVFRTNNNTTNKVTPDDGCLRPFEGLAHEPLDDGCFRPFEGLAHEPLS